MMSRFPVDANTMGQRPLDEYARPFSEGSVDLKYLFLGKAIVREGSVE